MYVTVDEQQNPVQKDESDPEDFLHKRAKKYDGRTHGEIAKKRVGGEFQSTGYVSFSSYDQ